MSVDSTNRRLSEAAVEGARHVPMRAAIYARISDDPEGREAGVTRQVEDCEAEGERLGWTFGPWKPFIDNDISASTLSKKRRPAYEEMMQLVRDGEIDGIIFYTNGRLTRRPIEYEAIIELYHLTGVQLKSVKSVNADLSTADGRFIARTLAAQDAAEAERISERVNRSNQQRRKAGRPEPTSRAFGYEKGGEVIIEEEAALIREAVDRIIDENWSLGAVVNDWNKRDIPTVRGGKGWSRIQVSRALTSPRTAGLLSLKGEIVGDWEAGRIITPERRKELLAAIKGKRKNNVQYESRKHVLSGYMVCGKCGANMKVNALYDTDGSYRKDSFIHCPKAQFGCGSVKRNYLHVWGYIDGIIRNRIELHESIGAPVTGDEGEEGPDLKALEAELEAVRQDIADLKEALDRREIRFPDYNATLSTYRTQEDAAQKALAEAAVKRLDAPEVDLLAAWEDGSVLEKRAIFEWCIDHVKLHPIGRVGPYKALELVPTATEIVFKEVAPQES